eukprot:365390-Chlamydomonas_euryale.AAC.13
MSAGTWDPKDVLSSPKHDARQEVSVLATHSAHIRAVNDVQHCIGHELFPDEQLPPQEAI